MTMLVWDKVTALKRVRNKADRLARLVNVFLQSMPSRFEQMAQAVESEDLAACANLAHAIKGVSANLGADALQQLSSQAEKASLAGDMVEVISLWPNMVLAYESLLTELRQFLASLEG